MASTAGSERTAERSGRLTVTEAAETAGGQEPPQPDDVAKQAQRLRSLPVDQLIADALFSLLGAAQVKLGRRDARLLIDVTTVAHHHSRPYLPDELTSQIDQVLGQLRLGQVSAEGHTSKQGEPEENDLKQVPRPPSAT
jgi:hypothetical protein